MRVLQLTSHLNVGGITSHVLSLSKELARRGHGVAVASGDGTLRRTLTGQGIAHWPVPLSTSAEFSPQVLWAAWRLAGQLSREPMDVLHGHTRVGQVVAALLSRWLGLPYVATWHGFFRQHAGRRRWPCTGERTIAISGPVRDHLITDFHVQAERIRLIPHGIEMKAFETPIDLERSQRLRGQLGLPPSGPVVGTVARLVAAKGVDQLVRSAASIQSRLPGAHVLIVGDGEERGRLRALARELGVAELVHFAGSVPQTHPVLSLLQVFVFLPAEREGFGLSLLEAMASGVPIVALRRGGGAAWLLDELGVGTIVQPGDVEGLAEAILRLLQDGDAAAREGRRCRMLVHAGYDVGRMVDDVEAVYREVLTSPSRAARPAAVEGARCGGSPP